MTSLPFNSTHSRQTRLYDVKRGTTSPPLDNTQSQTASGVACHHRLWTAHTVDRSRAWHAIIAFRKHTGSNDSRHGMPSSPLDCTNGLTMFGVACHHCLSTSSHNGTASCVACHHLPWTTNMVERHRAWHSIIAFGLADTVGRCPAWHAIIPIGQHRRSNDVGRGIPSSPLD